MKNSIKYILLLISTFLWVLKKIFMSFSKQNYRDHSTKLGFIKFSYTYYHQNLIQTLPASVLFCS
jgi:hypothetical protein